MSFTMYGGRDLKPILALEPGLKCGYAEIWAPGTRVHCILCQQHYYNQRVIKLDITRPAGIAYNHTTTWVCIDQTSCDLRAAFVDTPSQLDWMPF